MRPVGGKLVDGRPGVFRTAELVCHVLLLEREDGLVLVDTGMGLEDVRTPSRTLARHWRLMSRPVLDERETALRQVEALGYRASDVRDIVLTHLDLDHGGGLRDFPEARVHVLAEELAVATRAGKTGNDRTRYPDAQWAHKPRWVTYEDSGESWFGFDGVREVLAGVLFVPLFGHTHGHSGVAVDTGSGWLLHAGDAYFHHRETGPDAYCPPALRFLQKRMEVLPELRLSNQDRLRALVGAHGAEVDVFNAHDLENFRRFRTS
ncbi:MBL fold metallo-hydrolase [Saccharothrix violaceirubra]